MIRFHCPGCRTPLRAREENAGQKTKCPTCGAAVVVPAAAPHPPAVAEVVPTEAPAPGHQAAAPEDGLKLVECEETVPLSGPQDAVFREYVTTWDYLVEDVYDDFSVMPRAVLPNRLMLRQELRAYVTNVLAAMKGQALPMGELSEWTLQKYLQARGSAGWEIAQATRLQQSSGVNGIDPVYWRIIFKKPRA
jgi:hypothetical protein